MPARRPPLRPLTLRFYDDALEAAYREDSVQTNLSIARVTLVMGALLFAAYGWLDQMLVPHDAGLVWAIRFPIDRKSVV